MNPWRLLDGKKSLIGGALLFASAFTDQVITGIWSVDWPTLGQASATCDWLGMAMGGVGLTHKWSKARAVVAAKEVTDAQG